MAKLLTLRTCYFLSQIISWLGTHSRGGPLGRGPGVSSGRSPEPAGGTEQTGKGRAEGRPQGGTTDNGIHSNGRGFTTAHKAGYFGMQEGGINAGPTGGTTTIFLRSISRLNEVASIRFCSKTRR